MKTEFAEIAPIIYRVVQIPGWKGAYKHGSLNITHQGGTIFLLLKVFILKNKYMKK